VYAWELASGNPYVRYAALQRLRGVPADLREGAVACLRDKDLVVRLAAARALADAMGEDAITGMVEALDLGEPELKSVAMRALAFPGAGAAVPRLLAERDDPLGALRALATIGDPRANHLLAAALEDPLLPAGLRARCVETLAKWADATPRLREALLDASPAVRTAARIALEPPPPPPPDPARVRALVAVLHDASAPVLYRQHACEQLAALRAEEAVPVLKRLCRPHVEEGVRLEAARALVAITGETRGFEPGQGVRAREAAYRAWAEEE
jgi:HEAT repeat protein